MGQMIADARVSSPTMAQKKKPPPKPSTDLSYSSAADNIMTQKNGFGAWLQKFQTQDKNSKYGVPIFDENGNVNPAYLAAERKEMADKKKQNIAAAEKKNGRDLSPRRSSRSRITSGKRSAQRA